MAHEDLLELAEKIEATETLDLDLADAAVRALRAQYPNEASSGLIPDGITASTDALVALVGGALPGWYFSIHGRAWQSAGPWTCSLRRSEVLDDDDDVGTANAHTLSQAVLAAMLRVAAWR